MHELFVVGDNYIVDLNKAWISTVPEFRRLLTKDKGGPGDGSGKYKKQAQREFTFIYHRYDFRSYTESWKEDKRHEECLRISGLERGKVEADGDLWEAIRQYEKMLHLASITLQAYRDMKEAVQDLTGEIRDMKLSERTEMGAKVYNAADKQKAIIGMGATLKSLSELEQLVKQELSGDTGLRGDAEKGGDEDIDEDDKYN